MSKVTLTKLLPENERKLTLRIAMYNKHKRNYKLLKLEPPNKLLSEND